MTHHFKHLGRRSAFGATLLAAAATTMWASSPSAQADTSRLAFEVASIHRARPFHRDVDAGPQEKVEFGVDRFTARNAPLNTLFQVAFSVTQDQVSAHPAMDDRFDIDGKAAGPASRDQLRQMLQTLLADRFKLLLHHETKEMPAYELVIGKQGHKLHDATGGPDAGWEIVNLISSLWQRLDAPVINMTGLSGRYENKIIWRAFNDPADPESAIRAALADQFGLALERRRAKVDFLVIDRLEKLPSDN